jgi:N-methylhydantoinase A/oxoprolinase/acetone carboxylase beta subunit
MLQFRDLNQRRVFLRPEAIVQIVEVVIESGERVFAVVLYNGTIYPVLEETALELVAKIEEREYDGEEWKYGR